ncbi:DUF6777 domain-containing protein [Streptomyces inhibens]|uniref:DUF6777 domain-containing protein n=1 Tax=Streptomyces inhibens TaxID=2293571 RepID=UPI001EE7765A|nr:DUF6777 domain-containing protein [Streptomyces inhibens]UKY53461.1 hypothetical protein KI385_34785 [Streptomyces inhibens]
MILTVVLTRPNGGAATAEVFAEPTGSTGQHPFTQSTANESTPSPSATPRKSGGTRSAFHGSEAGLYGGSQKTASCDVDKQISYLKSEPVKNRAFAGVLGKAPEAVPSYLKTLTPVRLSYDTRVTNHGFKDGRSYDYQSVLQAGTAVMVDPQGLPRVRCKCGNPLTEPKEFQKGTRTRGQTWPGYQPSNSIAVLPAPTKVKEFTLRNPQTGTWFKRPEGPKGSEKDTPTAPPAQTPSGPASSQPPPYRDTPPPDVSSGKPSGTSASGPDTSSASGTNSTGPSDTSSSETGTSGTTDTGSPSETTGGSSETGGSTEPPASTTEGSKTTTGATTEGSETTGGSTPGGGEESGGGSPGSGGSPGGGEETPGSSGTAPAT